MVFISPDHKALCISGEGFSVEDWLAEAIRLLGGSSQLVSG